MRTITLLVIAGAALIEAQPVAGQLVGAPLEFEQRVGVYLDIHHAAVAANVPNSANIAPDGFADERQRLAAAIRLARPRAARGDLFTPDVAEFFRIRIETATREVGYARFAEERKSEQEYLDAAVDLALEINGEVPPHDGPPVCGFLLARLPALPGELEYRVIGDDLLIVDRRAGLVVDILEAAVPPTAPAVRSRPFTPCDVHPDLPACWS